MRISENASVPKRNVCACRAIISARFILERQRGASHVRGTARRRVGKGKMQTHQYIDRRTILRRKKFSKNFPQNFSKFVETPTGRRFWRAGDSPHPALYYPRGGARPTHHTQRTRLLRVINPKSLTPQSNFKRRK